VFGDDLLYLYYGVPAYRRTDGPKRNAVELPVTFMFEPSILTHVARYYPFDTGALSAGRFGAWLGRLGAFRDNFGVTGTGDHLPPCRLVHSVYGDNINYLDGVLRTPVVPTDPIPLLTDFLSDDLSGLGVDKRQCMIECHTLTPLRLDRSLSWVAYPKRLTSVFARLARSLEPWVPESYEYRSHVIVDPRDAAAQIEAEAIKRIHRFIARPL
jgi:hypothetical protein